jgi:hypothetical protein
MIKNASPKSRKDLGEGILLGLGDFFLFLLFLVLILAFALLLVCHLKLLSRDGPAGEFLIFAACDMQRSRLNSDRQNYITAAMYNTECGINLFTR